jgi:hypothetical protein
MANIIRSIGNYLTDIPTLASLGAAVSTGGVSALANPALLGRLGLSVGVDFLGQRRQDEFNKRQRDAQALANLQSAISPRGQQFQPIVDVPKAGLLEKLGRAGQTGLAVFDAAKQAKALRAAQVRQGKLTAAQLEELEMERERQIGIDAADAVQARRPPDSIIDPTDMYTMMNPNRATSITLRAPSFKEIATPPGLSDTAGAAFQGQLNRRQETLTERQLKKQQESSAQAATKRRDELNEQNTLNLIEIRNRQIETVESKQRKEATTKLFEQLSTRAQEIGTQIGSTGETIDPEVIRNQVSLLSADAEIVTALEQIATNQAMEASDKMMLAQNKIITRAFENTKGSNAGIEFEKLVFDFKQRGWVIDEARAKEISDLIISAESVLNLPATEAARHAKLLSLETQLEKIETLVGSADFDFETEFGTGMLAAIQRSWAARTVEPIVLELATQMGFTSEFAVRVFSGAAVRDEEFDRFRKDFIGALSSGKEAVLAKTSTFRQNITGQRNDLLNTARFQLGRDPVRFSLSPSTVATSPDATQAPLSPRLIRIRDIFLERDAGADTTGIPGFKPNSGY